LTSTAFTDLSSLRKHVVFSVRYKPKLWSLAKFWTPLGCRKRQAVHHLDKRNMKETRLHRMWFPSWRGT